MARTLQWALKPRRIGMQFSLKIVMIAVICVIVALVIISILISAATGQKSVVDALLEFLRGEMPVL